MKPITVAACRVMCKLVEGLSIGQARTIGGPRGGLIMPVSVECIGPDLFSVSHYYEQQGDLMADPDMTFYRFEGKFYPASYQQDSLGIYRRGIEFNDDGTVKGIRRHEQKDQAIFASGWMKNIREQQAAWFELPAVPSPCTDSRGCADRGCADCARSYGPRQAEL